MNNHHVLRNGDAYDLQRVTDIQLDSLRQRFPDSLVVYSEWITRQTGPVDGAFTMPAAAFYSSPQNWIRSPKIRPWGSESLLQAPDGSETIVPALSPPQTNAEDENASGTRSLSIEATSISRSTTTSSSQINLAFRESSHINSASARTTASSESHRPMSSASSEGLGLRPGALHSTRHATISRSLNRRRFPDWNGSGTEYENPIQHPSYPCPSLGFPNAIYPRRIITRPRTYSRPSALQQVRTAFEISTSAETPNSELQFTDGLSLRANSDCSLRYISPILEGDEENESHSNGSAFGYPLHPYPSRILAWAEEVALTTFGCAANGGAQEISRIQDSATQSRMHHVFRATWPPFDPDIEDYVGDAEDEDRGDEEEGESLQQGYLLIGRGLWDVTSSDRRKLRSWNGKLRRGSGCPSYRVDRNLLWSWNGRARSGSKCLNLVDRESEDEIKNEGGLEAEPEQKLGEKEEKEKRRWRDLGKVKEWGKKILKK